MADNAPVVHIGENSPELIAYKLFNHIVTVENKTLYRSTDSKSELVDRKWILETYVQCIEAVKHGVTPK